MQWINKETNRFTFNATLIISSIFFGILFLILYVGLNYKELIYRYKTEQMLNQPIAQLTFLKEYTNIDYNKNFIDNIEDSINKTTSKQNIGIINVLGKESNLKKTTASVIDKTFDKNIKISIFNGHGYDIWTKGLVTLKTSQKEYNIEYNIKDGDNILFEINDNNNKIYYILHGTSLKNKDSQEVLFIKRHSDNSYNKKLIFSDGHSIETIYNPIPEFSKIIATSQSEREKLFFGNILKHIKNDKKIVVIHYGDYHVTSNDFFIDNDGKNTFKIYLIDMGDVIDIYSEEQIQKK